MASQKPVSKYASSSPFAPANLATVAPAASSGLLMPKVSHSLNRSMVEFMIPAGSTPSKSTSKPDQKKTKNVKPREDSDSEAMEVEGLSELENDGERDSEIEGHEHVVDLEKGKKRKGRKPGITTDDIEDGDFDSDEEPEESENEEDRNP